MNSAKRSCSILSFPSHKNSQSQARQVNEILVLAVREVDVIRGDIRLPVGHFHRLVEKIELHGAGPLGGAHGETVAVRVREQRPHALIDHWRPVEQVAGAHPQLVVHSLFQAERELIRIPEIENEPLFRRTSVWVSSVWLKLRGTLLKRVKSCSRKSNEIVLFQNAEFETPMP